MFQSGMWYCGVFLQPTYTFPFRIFINFMMGEGGMVSASLRAWEEIASIFNNKNKDDNIYKYIWSTDCLTKYL